MDPTLGRIVLFRVTQAQSEEVMRRRTNGRSIAKRLKLMANSETGEDETIYGWPEGAQAHIGNPLDAGAVVPMIVTSLVGNGINGQAVLDGNDVLWVIHALEGTEPGTWHWPPRA